MKFKNLMPHPITIFRMDGDGPLCSFAPEPRPFRLVEADKTVVHDWIENQLFGDNLHLGNWRPEENYCLFVPVVDRAYDLSSLPPEEEKVCYIVSLPALMGLRAAGVTRTDLVAPDTGPGPYGAVRDDKGVVIGCYRLVSIGGSPTDHKDQIPFEISKWVEANPAPATVAAL